MLETWKNSKSFSFLPLAFLKCPIYKVKNSLPKWFLSEHQSQITVASTAQTFRWCQDGRLLLKFLNSWLCKKSDSFQIPRVYCWLIPMECRLIVTTEVLLSCTNPKILLHEVVTLKFLLQWQFWGFAIFLPVVADVVMKL